MAATGEQLVRAEVARVPAPGPLARIRLRFRRFSFRNKLVVISTAVSLICLLLAAAVLISNEVRQFRAQLLARSVALADVTAANSVAALAFGDVDGATQLLANLAAEPSIESARIVAEGSIAEAPFAQYSRHGVLPTIAPDVLAGGHRFGPQRLEVVRPIVQEGETLGVLHLEVSLGQLDETLRRFVLTLSALAALTVVVAWMLSYRLQGVVTRPVDELVDTARRVSRERDYSLRARVLAEDELGALTHAFNAMLDEVQAHDAAREAGEAQIRQLNEGLEAKVQARTEELQARNVELNQAVETLRTAQSQLVEAEKMAALGGLVAGVAHEINTPLGMCVTMVSHLGDQVRTLHQRYDEGMRRRDLEEFMEACDQSVAIIQTNLSRAAELVRSFKLVAVDQSSEVRRRFRVAAYLNEVLVSLRPQLKKSAVRIELDVAPELEIDSYPGVLAQIVTNLTVNALIHAYRSDDTGTIRIAGRIADDDWFELDFRDDGAGMSEQVRSHVFDPFFTTRRGEGGSGLGLHIVYNQVTQTLAGTIRCQSAPGQGSRFLIRFPVAHA